MIDDTVPEDTAGAASNMKEETSGIESVDTTQDSVSTFNMNGRTGPATTYNNILVKQLLNSNKAAETESSKSDITSSNSPPRCDADRRRAMELGVTKSVANVMLELVDMNIFGKLEEPQKAKHHQNNGVELPGILQMHVHVVGF